jgi:hypothetical protein
METVNRLAMLLKMHNTPGSVVHHVAILKKVLDARGIQCKMVKGYCVIPVTSEACQHYWIRTDEGLDLDVGFRVACLKSPELQALHPLLTDELPEGLERSDTGESLILAENSRLFDLFTTDTKAFWNEAPREVKAFSIAKV